MKILVSTAASLALVLFAAAVSTGIARADSSFDADTSDCSVWAGNLSELTDALSQHVEIQRESLKLPLHRLDTLAEQTCNSSEFNRELDLAASVITDKIFAADDATPAERVLSRALLLQVKRR